MIESELLAIARVGLPGAPPPPPDGWDELLDAVVANGLAGLFSSSAAAGMVDIDATMAARLQKQLELEATRAVQLEGELLRLAPTLASIGAAVMGGPILAHGAYPDPLFRPFAHLDLLVAGRRMPEAIAVFAHYGYHRAETASGSDLDTRVGKAFVLEHPGGVVIHLHRTLAAGSIGDEAGRPAGGHRRDVMVGSHAVPAPSWEAHLLECTLDAVVGSGLTRPLALRDIAEVVHHPALDPVAAVELAERWQVARPVGYSLRAARDGLGLDLPPALATLARRSAEPPPTVAATAPAPDHLSLQHDGDAYRHVPPARSLGALQEVGGTLTPAPAHVPALPAADAVPPGELATVNLAGRSTPSPVRTAHRNGTLHPAGSVTAGRQGAWTSARPPRQGTSRERSPGETGSSRNSAGDRSDDDSDGPGPPAGVSASDPTSNARTSASPSTRKGLALGVTGGTLLVATSILSRVGNDTAGTWLVPLAGLLLAGAAARRIGRRHPGEDWVGRWLVLAVAVKLTAAYLRYQVLVNEYEGVGDATYYDDLGRQFASAWLGSGSAPELENLRQHNFISWFTGVVYYLFGSNMMTGFLTFGLLAVAGSYLWYRATVDAVPNVDKRLYLGLVLFLPSMAYWPAGIGKESLMQLAIGMLALATAYLFRHRLASSLAIGAAGGWLLWAVRPHLLALVMVAVGCAYVGGRVRAGDHGLRGIMARPVGLLAVALLMGFAVSQSADFLGIEDLSVRSIEAELDEATERSSGGTSGFDTGGNSLNPIYLPQGAVTVLLRPFPWETDSSLQLLASLESVLLAAFLVVRVASLTTALARGRTTPFLLYSWVLVLLYAATFSSFSNFGVIVRQRSLVLPALFVLIAVRPARTSSAAATMTPATTRSATTRGVHAGG